MSDASSSSQQTRSPSQYVEETHPFFSLFPHRFDFIWADIPIPGQAVEWQTEKRYPLGDRMIEQGQQLYGVRFGKESYYALLDIDINSPYHPKRDPFAIRHILEALEPLGIVHSITLSSSYSNGIHIYLPFAQAQKCGSLSQAIATLLEVKGYKIAPGRLEIFPDPKPYNPNGKPQLYNGHRLPLQMGSYLLNEDWHPIYSTQEKFVRLWQFCQEQNDVTEETVQHILKTYQRRQYRVSAKASKFLNDLNAEIEKGWTDHGQTNWILGRIAMREYIFGHVSNHISPLEGDDLVEQIVKVAIALPGYEDWCRHQHEIRKRATEWARSIEKSRYFHYGSKSSNLSTLTSSSEEEKVPWNEQQSQAAREKIRQAIAQMLTEGTLPAGTTARFKALTQYRISGETLYRHVDLWHPGHLQEAIALPDPAEPVEIPPHPPEQIESVRAQSLGDYARIATSLLQPDGRNSVQDEACEILATPYEQAGCNVHIAPLSRSEAPEPLTTGEAIATQKQRERERQQQRHIERMQQYLDSGDPILIKEAIAWAQANPGILKKPPQNLE